MLRHVAAVLTATALLLLLAVPAMAGGWAEVRADAMATTEPPRDDQPVVIGFTVLQHGETPAGWVTPTVHLTDLTTGTTIDLPASGRGPDGHFVATFTPINPGFMSWTVSFPELIAESQPVTLTIHHADGTAPVFDPALALTAMEGARTTARDEAVAVLQPQIDLLQGQAGLQRNTIDRLTAEVATLTEARDASTDALAVSSGALAGIILLAVLAGGTAGFLMAWLAGRGGPRQTEATLTTAPRGSTPG